MMYGPVNNNSVLWNLIASFYAMPVSQKVTAQTARQYFVYPIGIEEALELSLMHKNSIILQSGEGESDYKIRCAITTHLGLKKFGRQWDSYYRSLRCEVRGL